MRNFLWEKYFIYITPPKKNNKNNKNNKKPNKTTKKFKTQNSKIFKTHLWYNKTMDKMDKDNSNNKNNESNKVTFLDEKKIRKNARDNAVFLENLFAQNPIKAKFKVFKDTKKTIKIEDLF